MDENGRLTQAAELQKLADNLRPAVQAVVDYTVAAAKAVLAGGPDQDEVWAGTVVSVGQSLGLDLEHPGQLSAAVAVTELVMQQAGYQR